MAAHYPTDTQGMPPTPDRTMTDEAFMTRAQVCARTAHSKTTLYEAIRAGTFPRPRKRGARSLWVKSEVDAAIAAEKARMDAQAGACATAE